MFADLPSSVFGGQLFQHRLRWFNGHDQMSGGSKWVGEAAGASPKVGDS
jgi:hypothetical protein